VLDAPSNLGLRPPAPAAEPGVYQMPAALRNAGLLAQLARRHIVRDGGSVPRLPYNADIDLDTGIRNAHAIRLYSRMLAEPIESARQAGEMPLVLGGDCSILLGCMLALRRAGRYGLLFIDGHSDYLDPSTSQTGGAAGMDLALVTGFGPPLLAEIDGYTPLVQPADAVAFAFRDLDDAEHYPGKALFTSGVHWYTLEHVRLLGLDAALRQALAHFSACDGFWVHIDCDVIDAALLPAVDSPMPDGLNWDELTLVLRTVYRQAGLAGFDFTIFDPLLDPYGAQARALAGAIAHGLR
jgi:arginase